MRATTILILTSVSLTMSLAMPVPALARQSVAPVATEDLGLPTSPGVEPGRLLRMPASLFSIAPDDQPPPNPSSTSLTFLRSFAGAASMQGSVTATAAGAGQTAQPFVKAKLSRVALYALQLTFYEHFMSVATQEFTRQALKGKFWPDYFDSLHVPTKWQDKDYWVVNWFGHAISGGAFARIWMEQRETRATSTSHYLKSMGRAMIFTTIFSVQYEMGPMSEASIGNVGMNPDDLGWNDYIWTPIGGVLWTIAEDAIDKYALTWIDKHVPFFMAKAAARMILNPSRLLANIGMNRSPWNRTSRTMMGEPTGRR